MRPALTSALLLLAACGGGDGLTIYVDLRTDLGHGEDFDRVETLLSDEPIGPSTETRRVEASGLEGAGFVEGHRVAELDGVREGTRYVRVQLLRADGGLVARRDVVVSVDRSLAITVIVSRRCEGLTCPGVDDPASATSCLGGRCVDPRCTPETPEHCGEPECSAAAPCPGTSGCLESVCAEGTCLSAPQDRLCPGAGRCTAGGVCVSGGTDGGRDAGRDGGPLPGDAGRDAWMPPPPPDAGADAGPPPARTFCPDDALLREEMAVFLVRYRHGPSFVPPPAAGTFSDVPAGSSFAPWIEQLQRDGVTNGCATGRYCPSDPVLRDVAAVFFVRARYGGTYAPAAASGTVFSDVPRTLMYASFIEQLARDGVTNGCRPSYYCPTEPLTRAQTAIFLVRMLRGAAYTPPAATGIFSDVPASRVEAPFIEQLYRDGYTDGCLR